MSSCFAQHIARHLAAGGFTYFVTETAHPLVAHMAAECGYGMFTARYGNIYTSRQFLQTLKRAYGSFLPQDDAWPTDHGRVLDPYRPRIQPGGFACREELIADRRQHFAAVRCAIEEAHVFVFTLGLTETWVHRSDGAPYPLCPGVAGGSFNEEQHGFVNLGVTDVLADLSETIALIRVRNAGIRFILTVSPVPLVATMEDRSVLASTTYSKSVLRVAAEEIARRHEGVDYFPAYEIVTGNHARGRYFDEGLREVTEAGVSHVMRLFMRHYVADITPAEVPEQVADTRRMKYERVKQELEELAGIMCDEVSLDAGAVPTGAAASVAHVSEPQETNAPSPPSEAAESARVPSAWEVLIGTVPRPIPPQPIPLPQSRPRPKGLWSWFRRRRPSNARADEQ